MVLTNAERQARYRARLKTAASRGAHSAEAWRRAERIVDAIEQALESATNAELESRAFRDLLAGELRALRNALSDAEAAQAIESEGIFYKPSS